MEKYGFYGGCFNPPTKAHILLAKKTIKKYKLNKLFFVPVGNKYNKEELVDENKRLEMLQIAIDSNKKFDVLDIELNKNKNQKANEIFKIIQNKYNSTDNYFIMGADNFIQIDKWEDADNLIKNFKYIILSRNNLNIKEYIKHNFKLNQNRKNYKILGNKSIDISSTQIRKIIKENKKEELHKYLENSVIEYIEKNNLYSIKEKNA